MSDNYFPILALVKIQRASGGIEPMVRIYTAPRLLPRESPICILETNTKKTIEECEPLSAIARSISRMF